MVERKVKTIKTFRISKKLHRGKGVVDEERQFVKKIYKVLKIFWRGL